MKNFYAKIIVGFTMFLFCFLKSYTQWSTDANVDNALNAKIAGSFNFCNDGHGGAIYTWDSSGSGGHRTIYANRIDSLGFLRWGTKGILIHTDTASLFVLPDPHICEDGKGGCYIAWSDNNTPTRPIFCQHLDSNGIKLWGSNGKQPVASISTQPYQVDSWLVNDNGKGVFIVLFAPTGDSTNGLRAQRLNFTGAKQWGSRGVLIEKAGDIRQPKAISDGKNGIVIAWTNYSFDGLGHQHQIRMNSLNHSGAARFTFGNKKLNTLEDVGFGPLFRLILTKKKNIIAVWTKDNGFSTPKVYTQKIDSAGNFLWGSSEITVRDTSGTVKSPDIMSDGSDGAYYVWNDGRKSGVIGVFAQHLNNSGAKKWQLQGVHIDSNSKDLSPFLAPDVNNGMKIFWVNTMGNREYMQRLDKNGVAQIAGLGTAIGAANHYPFYYRSVLPASNNHDIIFSQSNGVGICFAQYVPFGGVLPLTFLNFKGVNNGEKNVLSWQTTSAINTNYFSVERSDDGYNFYEIAKQENLNTQSISNYSYSDAAIKTDKVFYRLKFTDVNGNADYSKIISLQNNVSVFKITPNPAAKICTIYFDAVAGSNSILKIFNENGKQQRQIMLTPKQTSAAIDVSSFAAGIYFCRLETTGKTFTQKLIVIK